MNFVCFNYEYFRHFTLRSKRYTDAHAFMNTCIIYFTFFNFIFLQTAAAPRWNKSHVIYCIFSSFTVTIKHFLESLSQSSCRSSLLAYKYLWFRANHYIHTWLNIICRYTTAYNLLRAHLTFYAWTINPMLFTISFYKKS